MIGRRVPLTGGLGEGSLPIPNGNLGPVMSQHVAIRAAERSPSTDLTATAFVRFALHESCLGECLFRQLLN